MKANLSTLAHINRVRVRRKPTYVSERPPETPHK